MQNDKDVLLLLEGDKKVIKLYSEWYEERMFVLNAYREQELIESKMNDKEILKSKMKKF
jgi:hypothetical protein